MSKAMSERMEINLSVETLWKDFLRHSPDNKIKEAPIGFYFCEMK